MRPLVRLEPDQQEEVWRSAVENAAGGKVTARVNVTAEAVEKAKKAFLKEDYESPAQLQKTQFNRAFSLRIDWAKWSWNPLTGCKHGCEYCYARDITIRLPANYPKGFEPHWRPERLGASGSTKIPEKARNQQGIKNVFVCSMGDLFGDWVKPAWINAVLKTVRTHSEWTYIFLTKNPKRLVDIKWPDNAWVGATVDVQKRVEPTIAAMDKVKAKVRFISCEPLLEEIKFPTMKCIDWLIIGPRSKGGAVSQPEEQWVINLMRQAWDAGKKVYCKPDLRAAIREYPGD